MKWLALILILAVPATAEPVWVDGVEYTDSFEADSEAQFLAVFGSPGDAHDVIQLEISAAHVRVERGVETGVWVGTSDTGSTAGETHSTETFELVDTTMAISAQRAERSLLLFADTPVSAHVDGQEARVSAVDSPTVSYDGVRPATPGAETTHYPYFFSNFVVEGGHVVFGGGAADMALTGDFILEAYEFDMSYVNSDVQGEILTGFRFTSSSPAADYEDAFARMHFTGATLRYSAATAHQWWGGSEVVAATDGDILLRTTARDESIAETVLPGGAYVLTPRYSKIGLTSPDAGTSVSVALPASWQSGLLSAGLAVTLLAFAIFIAVRLGHNPQRAMEKALESGDHTRAAAVAASILQKEPHNEAARIGRAVALTRGGRSRDVVAELEQHRRMHTPSDGVLDYLLGIAYLETGRRKEAREALERAIGATPALAPDAAARMPGLVPRMEGAYA